MVIICEICNENLERAPEGVPSEDYAPVSSLDCGHIFHTFCLVQWINAEQPSSSEKNCYSCSEKVVTINPIFPTVAESRNDSPTLQDEDEVLLSNALRHLNTIRPPIAIAAWRNPSIRANSVVSPAIDINGNDLSIEQVNAHMLEIRLLHQMFNRVRNDRNELEDQLRQSRTITASMRSRVAQLEATLREAHFPS